MRPDTKKKKEFLCVFEFSLAHDDDYIPPPLTQKTGDGVGGSVRGL